MIIQIPDDIARALEGMAAAQHRSVEQLAVERLRDHLHEPASPQALLRTIRALPHPSPSAVDDLEAVIAESRLPVREQGVFDMRPGE
jgi:plasmid stability protein